MGPNAGNIRRPSDCDTQMRLGLRLATQTWHAMSVHRRLPEFPRLACRGPRLPELTTSQPTAGMGVGVGPPNDDGRAKLWRDDGREKHMWSALATTSTCDNPPALCEAAAMGAACETPRTPSAEVGAILHAERAHPRHPPAPPPERDGS